MRFWLAAFDLPPRTRRAAVPAQPILASQAKRLAIEVIWDEATDEFGVLISRADELARGHLTCCIGFANGAKNCRIWRDRGFPLIDARIDVEQGKLQITAPYFGPRQRKLEYAKPLLVIDGVDFGPARGAKAALGSAYAQAEFAPDYAWPGRFVSSIPVEWTPQRTDVRQHDNVPITLAARQARNPNLIPLDRGGTHAATVWTGEVSLRKGTLGVSPGKLNRLSRADTFGAPAFRFEDVEVLGFRLDVGGARARDNALDATRQALDVLVRDLNFHLEYAPDARYGVAREPEADFRYRVATTTVVIELLRYGKMKLRAPWAPLDILDYQSQHELVVRLLVGRVDDDSAQAHSPAVYVPAIFVDNPWSKVLGRDLQGFDKWMAHFCVPEGRASVPLQMDGRLPAGSQAKPEPLDRIHQVHVARRMGVRDAAAEPLLLQLGYSQIQDIRPQDFSSVDIDLALNSSALALTRWRRSDFGDPEFRRSFARSVVGQAVRGFRSVQVSPVGRRSTDKFEKTWITGTFGLDDDVQVAPARGVATLVIHRPDLAPVGWHNLCKVLDIGAGEWQDFSFPSGSWYRMKFSMDLSIDNGFE